MNRIFVPSGDHEANASARLAFTRTRSVPSGLIDQIPATDWFLALLVGARSNRIFEPSGDQEPGRTRSATPGSCSMKILCSPDPSRLTMNSAPWFAIPDVKAILAPSGDQAG